MFCRLFGLAAGFGGVLAMLHWLPAGAGTAPAVEAPLAIESLLLDAAVAGRRLVVVGERGHVLFSDDRGETWKQARVPVRALLTAVHMRDSRTGFAVGHDAAILRTDDGAETWRIVHRAPEDDRPLFDIWFRDANAGFAIGAYGSFLFTEDGGRNWIPRTISEEDYHLNAFAAAGPARLFIAAEAGVLYRSDDNGRSWRKLPSPYSGSWFGALALDENRLLVAGLRGHLFLTADGGDSWTRVPTGVSATLTGVARLRSGLILVTGLDGALLASRDGGRTASPIRSPTRRSISSALAVGDGALLTGEFGVRRLARIE